MAGTSAGVETKVAMGAATSSLTGAVTWILVTYVPYFHDGLPAQLSTFVPYAVSVALGILAGWLAPHTPRTPVPLPVPVEKAPAPAGIRLIQSAGPHPQP